jgi:drug/metabolite transporter (DMT)-like permease
MSTRSTRPTAQPQDTTERRLRVAMRMSQLASARAVIFMIGIVCALFGAVALVLERDSMAHRLESTTSLSAALADSGTEVEMVSQDEQVLYIALICYGLICLVLAKYLYHAPMLIPVLCTVGFFVTYAVFWSYNHSESPASYTITSLLILAGLIVTIRAGHQFHLSYARMGRPDDR